MTWSPMRVTEHSLVGSLGNARFPVRPVSVLCAGTGRLKTNYDPAVSRTSAACTPLRVRASMRMMMLRSGAEWSVSRNPS